MKIAVITDDGKTISRHFGRAQYYLVFTIEDGKVTGREMRSKMGHQHFANEAHAEQPGVQHGMDDASHQKHLSMTEAIADCQTFIGGGMGMGALRSMESVGIETILTDLVDAEQAVEAYINGTMTNRRDLAH